MTNLSTDQTAMEKTPPAEAPRKFMFDRSFDGLAGGRAQERPRGPVTLKPEQVDALKKEAYDLGFAAGQKAGADAETQAMKGLMAKLDKEIGQLAAHFERAQQELDAQMRRAVLAIARKIMPDFAASHGLQEIEALLAKVIADMVHEPRLVVRVNETQFDAVNTKIHEITVQKAYAGKVVVLADEKIAPGDCRIEWADGGVERNAKAQMETIEKTIDPAGAAAAPAAPTA